MKRLLAIGLVLVSAPSWALSEESKALVEQLRSKLSHKEVAPIAAPKVSEEVNQPTEAVDLSGNPKENPGGAYTGPSDSILEKMAIQSEPKHSKKHGKAKAGKGKKAKKHLKKHKGKAKKAAVESQEKSGATVEPKADASKTEKPKKAKVAKAKKAKKAKKADKAESAEKK